MKNNFEDILNQDAKAIKNLAAARLKNMDFSQQFEPRPVPQQRQQRPWLMGLAAAFCLTVAAWMLLQNNKAELEVPTLIVANQKMTPLDLKQIPLTVEQKINQPLLEEQQAILEDLKKLRKSMLSI